MTGREKIEYFSRTDIEQLQLERLQSTLYRMAMNVDFYHKVFDQYGIQLDDFEDLSQLSSLPFTTKDDLRSAYPYGMFAVPLREVVRIHSTSGTTGKPVVVGLTKNDLQTWSELSARSLHNTGITDDDIVQIAYGYGFNLSGFGYHYGAEKLGAAVVPISTVDLERQLMVMEDFRSTVLVSTPAFTLKIIEMMKTKEINPNALNLRKGILGGEICTPEIKREIEESLFIKVFENYGLAEIMGTGVAGECEHRTGLHLNEDHFIAEIIDPRTGEVLPVGSEGELVLTTITKEAFPLLRYRTGDITRLIPGECTCGRKTVRMEKLMRRVEQAWDINGLKIFPSDIRRLFVDTAGIDTAFYLNCLGETQNDPEILVEITDGLLSDSMRRMRELHKMISDILEGQFGLKFKVKFVDKKGA